MVVPSMICTEEQMRFIQQATNATPQEILQTILLSRISVEEIIGCLKKAANKLMIVSERKGYGSSTKPIVHHVNVSPVLSLD